MSRIVFECLIAPAEVPMLHDAFAARLRQLVDAGRVDNPRVDVTAEGVADSTAEQLVAQWDIEHRGVSVGERSVYRFDLTFDRLAGSVNQIAVDLSQLLTPKVELPQDPIQREFDEKLQGVARYPWTVQVRL